MNTPAKLGAFAAVLGLAFGVALLTGAAIDDGAPASAVTGTGEGAGGHGHEGDASSSATPAARAAPGLAIAEDGYQLEPVARTLTTGGAVPYRFRIVDGRGVAQGAEFERNHERRLHLIVVRRDMAGFQHVHPTMAADGTWVVALDLTRPGAYRVFADFMIGGTQRTLGADLFVPGAFAPRPVAAPRRTATVAGRSVAIATRGVRAAAEGRVAFAVERDGHAVELQPYLGANGHLVALREGDLAYLHVHPVEGGSEPGHADGSSGDEPHGNEVAFAATFPTPGRYRLFLDFATDDEVHTAPFTIEVPR